MEEPPPIPERAVEEFSFDPGSGSDTSESSAAPTIAPGTNFVYCRHEYSGDPITGLVRHSNG